MLYDPIPLYDEQSRLAALEQLAILDTPQECEFDGLVAVAAAALGTGGAAISLVDRDRQWFKARCGTASAETPREHAFCAHTIQSGEILEIADASLDPRFAANPYVTAAEGIRFYAGAPLIASSGYRIGAFCVFDPRPRPGLTAEQRIILQTLAGIAAKLIEDGRLRRLGAIAEQVVEVTSDAIICCDPAGKITFWNRAAETMFGHNARTAIGLCLDLIIPDRMVAAHRAGMERVASGAPSGLIGKTVALSAKRADGSEFPIELSLGQWTTRGGRGFAAIVRDMSERDALQTQRAEAQAMLDTVVNNLPAMLFVKDADTLQYLLLNKAGEEIVGRRAVDIIGCTDEDLFPGYAAGYAERDRAVLQDESQKTLESEFVREDGATFRLRTTRAVIRGCGHIPRYVVGLSEDVTKVRSAEAEILHLAHHDPLTGLLNRRSLVDRLHAFVGAETAMAMLSIDLHQFKQVNDRHGHIAGDEVLAEVARRLEQIVEPGDLIARIGGDEFVLILAGGARSALAPDMARQIAEILDAPYVTSRGHAVTGAAIGIVRYPSDSSDIDTLRHYADLALYKAKARGRGQVCLFSKELDEVARDRRILESELRDAIDNGDIVPHYQPVFSTQTGRITSVEALARWVHRDRGPIPPEVFIGIAEESRQIARLGEILLRQACVDACNWQDDVRVAVNLSPLQFETGDLVETVDRALSDSGLAPNRLQLEVTEGLLIRDVDRTFEQLEQLRGLGIQILMDDFGIGYSSLSYFQRFRFDKVKIDRAFVSTLEGSRAASAIVRAVVGLASELDMGVVAEGVETSEQMRSLIKMGCTHVQGYLLSQPEPASVISAILCSGASRSISGLPARDQGSSPV